MGIFKEKNCAKFCAVEFSFLVSPQGKILRCGIIDPDKKPKPAFRKDMGSEKRRRGNLPTCPELRP